MIKVTLTLGRKPGEKLYIMDEYNREIEIEVVKEESGLKLRIDAHEEFKIVRGEILNR